MAEFVKLLANGATLGCALLDQGLELEGCGTAGFSIVLAGNPFLSGLLVCLAHLVALNHLVEEGLNACTHLLVGQYHTQTELAEILEEGVGPCGTLTLLVGGVRRGGDRAGIDGGAARSVGHHLTVAKELGDEFNVGRFAATRAGTAELEERSGKLRVLGVEFDIYLVLLARYVLHAVVPVGVLGHFAFEGHHGEGLVAAHTRTNVHAVAATEAVHYVNLHAEVHTLERGRSLDFEGGSVQALEFFVVEHEGTNRSVGTNERALVTLDTVLAVPCGYEGSHTALLVGGSSLLPSTVCAYLEGAHGQEVAVLCIDGAHEVGDKGGLFAYNLLVLGQVGPCGVNGQRLVFATAVNGLVVLVHYVLALLAVALNDKFLHLLYGEVNGDYFGDAEEGGLEDGVRAVAEANLLCNLRSVDIVNGDIVLGKVALHVVGQILSQLFAFPDGVEQEGAAVAQTAEHVVHVQISLNVASHEVRRLNLIRGADRRIAEAEVRAGETARFLRVVREVCLAIFVRIVADNLHGVLVGTDRTVCAEAIELGFEDAFATECHFFLEGQ